MTPQNHLSQHQAGFEAATAGHRQANIVVHIPRPRNEDDPRVLALKKELRSLIADDREVEYG